jgi:UPF0755 protein
MQLRKLFWWFTTIFFIAAVSLILAFQSYHSFLHGSLQVTEEGALLTVKPGDSVQSIARNLQSRNIIDSALYLQIYARLNGLAGRIHVGDYALTSKLTPIELFDHLIKGKVMQYSLTVVEGWTFHQMLAAVHNHEHIIATLKGLSDDEIMARLGYPNQHPEGWFFPDTYYFPRATTDLDFLKRAHSTMGKQLAAAWAQRAANIPLQTPYQALILASIIEKETGHSNERDRISGVFTRRLQKSMLLQTDPTVIYGLGEAFDGNLKRRDLKIDTPYNTYIHEGLPPTPIALPGTQSLLAAVQPATGKELYFVSRGDGSHQFSDNLKEHNLAIRKYQLNK